MKTLLWLWDVYQIRKIYTSLIFSHRQIFMNELRPKASGTNVICYPDAIFFVEDKDIKRAVRAVVNSKGKKQ